MNLQYTSVIYPINYNRRDGVSLFDVYHSISGYLKINDYTVKSRKKEIAYARHLFCYMSREFTDSDWNTIASHIGGRHHSTAVHSKNTLQDLFDTDPLVREDVANIKEIINQGRAIYEQKEDLPF